MDGRPRPPSRADAVILLASLIIAAPLAARADRHYRAEYPRPAPSAFEGRSVERPARVWALQWPIRRALHDGSFVLAALTLGVAAMFGRSPRSTPRAVPRQPGAAAVLVGAIVGVGCVLNLPVIRAVVRPVLPIPSAFVFAHDTLVMFVPSAVLGAWAVLLASGRRPRARPDWRERLGRAIGWCWLAFLAEPVVHMLLWG